MMIPTANLGTTTWMEGGHFKMTTKILGIIFKERQKGITYIESASTHLGSKVCSAHPEVSLVLVSDELHHEFTGLL